MIESLGFTSTSTLTFLTPYGSGNPIDFVVHKNLSSSDRDTLQLSYQSLVGSLNWLAHTTRPNLSTAVSLLAQHQSTPSAGQYKVAQYVTRYLANTKTLGIYFNRRNRSMSESSLQFPVPSQVMSISDANWGPQDATQSKSTMDLPLFASRSMSAFNIDLLGPLHWLSNVLSFFLNFFKF